jgi:hypothetical protein
LINTAKNFVADTKDYWAMYSAQLIRLDQCMRNYGPESDLMRDHLQSFTAAVIANLWRTEPAPSGVGYPDTRNMSRDDAQHGLTDLLNCIKLEILRLTPSDSLHEKLAIDCFDQYKEFATVRWSLPLEPRSSLSMPFLRMLISWLMIVFLCFGLRAPANPLAMIMIVLSATTLSSMMFAVMDMVNPYEGLYNISSKNMHKALDATCGLDVTRIGQSLGPLEDDAIPNALGGSD